ncbi:hypothetical protein MBANPS3_004838 [Mucor bainieri]
MEADKLTSIYRIEIQEFAQNDDKTSLPRFTEMYKKEIVTWFTCLYLFQSGALLHEIWCERFEAAMKVVEKGARTEAEIKLGEEAKKQVAAFKQIKENMLQLNSDPGPLSRIFDFNPAKESLLHRIRPGSSRMSNAHHIKNRVVDSQSDVSSQSSSERFPSDITLNHHPRRQGSYYFGEDAETLAIDDDNDDEEENDYDDKETPAIDDDDEKEQQQQAKWVLEDGTCISSLFKQFKDNTLRDMLKAVFSTDSLFEHEWANGVVSPEGRLYKPDFKVFGSFVNEKCVVVVSEFKPAKSHSQIESDRVKVDRQMRLTYNHLVLHGVPNPRVCGILCDGFMLSTLIMDLFGETPVFTSLHQLFPITTMLYHLNHIKNIALNALVDAENAIVDAFPIQPAS